MYRQGLHVVVDAVGSCSRKPFACTCRHAFCFDRRDADVDCRLKPLRGNAHYLTCNGQWDNSQEQLILNNTLMWRARTHTLDYASSHCLASHLQVHKDDLGLVKRYAQQNTGVSIDDEHESTARKRPGPMKACGPTQNTLTRSPMLART